MPEQSEIANRVQRKGGQTKLFAHKSLAENPDETMSEILQESLKHINEMIGEGASEIKLRWINIPDQVTNPYGDQGFVRIVGVRHKIQENK